MQPIPGFIAQLNVTFKVVILSVLAILVLPTFASGNVGRSAGATTYQIVGHYNLPTGYAISVGTSMPTYIPGANTVYVFAIKGSSTFLLALSGSNGGLRATPLRFSGGVSDHFVYDSLNNRLFISQTSNAGYPSTYRIVAISTLTNKVVANYSAKDGAAYIAYDSYNNQVYSTSCAIRNYCFSGTFVDVFNAATNAMKGHIQITTSGAGEINSILYDGKNHNIYVDYYVYNVYPYGAERIAVIQGNSLSVSKRMNAPDVASEYYQSGGYLVLDPMYNVLFDTQLPFSLSAPVGGYDAFNATTNTILPSLSSGAPSGNDVSSYDAGRQTVKGNYVIVTYDAGGFGRVQPASYEQSLTPSRPSISIPGTKATYSEVCGQALSSANFQANFADCQSWTPYASIPVGAPHMDILSMTSGALLSRITDPSVLVNGQRTYYHLYAFGDNTASHIEYAAADGSAAIYEISA